MIFTIEIQETLAKRIEVEADDIGQALAKANVKYSNEETVLTSDDHVDTDFIFIKQEDT